MSYEKQSFADGQVLEAAHLNHVEEGVADIDARVTEIEENGSTGNAELTHIDFSRYDSGSFVETVNGETAAHTVEFDEQGRPIKIDDIAITWG